MVTKFAPAVSDLKRIHRGKVREMFEVPGRDDLMLIVATDRISTDNIEHESTIRGKGKVLTQLTVHWMTGALKENNIKTHLVAHGEEIFKYVPVGITKDRHDLAQRAMIVKKLTMVPIEFINRDRMAGSLWKSYQTGESNPYGLTLPKGMRLMERFPETIFTPTEKSATDDPVYAETIIRYHQEEYLITRKAYRVMREHALVCGIDLIDSKSEVGYDDNFIFYIADECGTPDCCRFVEANSIVVGKEPKWFDKQYVREEASRIWGEGKKYPITFSPLVIEKTVEIYNDIRTRLIK